MSPNTPQDWLAVAKERGTDAEAIYKYSSATVGTVYMAGYAIECSLKALLQKRSIPFPARGHQGHNLQALWKASGFQLSDLKDHKGSQTFYLEHWSTDLRYEVSLTGNLGLEVKELLAGAKQLTGWIQNQVKRSKPRRRT